MGLIEERIIWQPVINALPEFSIFLNREFAIEMIHSKLPLKNQRRLNQIANEQLLKKFNISWLDPYLFHEDTYFVTQFNLGSGGIWLAVDGHQTVSDLIFRRDIPEPVRYCVHNVDCIKDAFLLQCLFDRWIYYSNVFVKP